MTEDELFFFNDMPGIIPLYDALAQFICQRFPDVSVKVQKSQITFKARYGFAFVSLRRMKGCPETFLIFSLGLPSRLDSPRVAVATEPYPGRWTTHFILSGPEQLDEELKGWIETAYTFAQRK